MRRMVLPTATGWRLVPTVLKWDIRKRYHRSGGREALEVREDAREAVPT